MNERDPPAAEHGWNLAPGELGYPGCLEELDETPAPTLHGLGRRSLMEEFDHATAVTIVGSRRPSSDGVALAEGLAADLGAAGIFVISGMALGIDAAAHRGVLAAGGGTLAVLAGGPDVIYPASERRLYRQILSSGVVVSERPPRFRPRKRDFPARNRLMAALGRVVIVVEAAQPSGSLITAEIGAKLGRTVGAVPGGVGSRVAEGTNALIKDGAELIRDAQDVRDLLLGVGSRGEPRRGPRLEPGLAAVLDALGDRCRTSEEVATRARVGAREAAIALVTLELLGYVRDDGRGAHRRTSLPSPTERRDSGA